MPDLCICKVLSIGSEYPAKSERFRVRIPGGPEYFCIRIKCNWNLYDVKFIDLVDFYYKKVSEFLSKVSHFFYFGVLRLIRLIRLIKLIKLIKLRTRLVYSFLLLAFGPKYIFTFGPKILLFFQILPGKVLILPPPLFPLHWLVYPSFLSKVFHFFIFVC